VFRKQCFAWVVIAVVAFPLEAPTALAGSTTKHTFYVLQDRKTLRCSVVTKIGAGRQVGPTDFPTRSAAAALMAAAKECNKM
jgi:hypothetical protein